MLEFPRASEYSLDGDKLTLVFDGIDHGLIVALIKTFSRGEPWPDDVKMDRYG